MKVLTDHPLATDSLDHIKPCGTKKDNSRHQGFNQKLFERFAKRPLYVMDLGCAGGGFVKDMIDYGQVAVGLDGSDYSLKNRRAEWATIPDNLFTCDITYPFEVIDENNTLAKFDVITAWEVMEHLPEERLGQVCKNVKNHLADDGMWIMSVSTMGDPYHVTVHDKKWWMAVFTKNGFKNDEDLTKYFQRNWVRNHGSSFHLVLRTK